MKKLLQTYQQLDRAELLLNEQQIEECFCVCEEVQESLNGIEENDEPNLSAQRERFANILRRLNRIMVEKMKARK